jgi:acetamidase/formamidase
MVATTGFVLESTAPHYVWDNAIPPQLTIQSGDTVAFQTRDAADGHFRLDSTAADVATLVFRGHPLTGPVRIEGAQPGDTLQIDILEVQPGSFGWTAILPGMGLLSEDFTTPHIRTWDLSDGQYARFGDLAKIPIEPFCGVMGLALAEAGELPTMPPRRTGGNFDIRQLVAGSTLYLPVDVDGALFSVGDAHAAQGDGEVCVSAVEMSSTVSLRFEVHHDRPINEPQFKTPGSRFRGSTGPAYVTTAHGPDLYASSQQAVRYMLDYLEREYRISREDAYCLSSVAVDLKISEIVDAPNWIVSAFLPLDIFA